MGVKLSKLGFFQHIGIIAISYLFGLLSSYAMVAMHYGLTDSVLFFFIIMTAMALPVIGLAFVVIAPFADFIEKWPLACCWTIFISVALLSKTLAPTEDFVFFICSATSFTLLFHYTAVIAITRHSQMRFKVFFKKLSLLTATLVLLNLLGYNYMDSRHRLSFVPKEFGTTRIVYSKENTWGFGPGGNETGIIVYSMPAKVASALRHDGLSYLHNLPSSQSKGKNWQGYYSTWAETPVVTTRHWVDYMSLPDTADYSKETPSVRHYMGAYGFGIEIDKSIEELIDKAINQTGNYYAYGRIGVIILIPAEEKIVYVYNG